MCTETDMHISILISYTVCDLAWAKIAYRHINLRLLSVVTEAFYCIIESNEV